MTVPTQAREIHVRVSDPWTTPVGLIGLGLMGSAIAQRLIAADIRVIGWDISAPPRAAHVDNGGLLASDLNDVFLRCRHIFLSLPDDKVVSSVLNLTRQHRHPGQTIVDTSTGAPASARHLFSALTDEGVKYLDATVSGSSEQLRKGDAVFLVGATEVAFRNCGSLLSRLSTKIFHTGPPGSGSQMKLVTNLVLGLNRAALAEGLSYASSLGLDLRLTLQMLRESMSYSRIMETKGEKMIVGDFAPQARLAQHLKDVQLMLADGERVSAPLPLTETHRKILEDAVAMGLGELDNSAIIRAFDKVKEDGQKE